MRHPSWLGLGAALLLACGGTTYPVRASHESLRPLEEARALRVIESALRDQGLAVELHRHVRIAGHRDVEVSAMIAGSHHGIEFVTAQGRAVYGSAIPPRPSPDALVTVPGAEADQGTDLLILDDQYFLYEPDPNLQGPGHQTVQEIEDRLQRDVIDYVTYLRDRHRL